MNISNKPPLMFRSCYRQQHQGIYLLQDFAFLKGRYGVDSACDLIRYVFIHGHRCKLSHLAQRGKLNRCSKVNREKDQDTLI